MNPVSRKNIFVPPQVQSSPVFFTGLSTTRTSQPLSLLCQLCNANLPSTSKSDDLCSDCKEIPPEISKRISPTKADDTITIQSLSSFLCQLCNANLPESAKLEDLCSDCKEIPPEISRHISPRKVGELTETVENVNVTPLSSQKAVGRRCLLNSPLFNREQLSDTVKSAIDSLRNTDIKIFENVLQAFDTKDRASKSETSWKGHHENRAKVAPYQIPPRDFNNKKFSSSSFQTPINTNGQSSREGNHIVDLNEKLTSALLHNNFSTPKSYQQLSSEIWSFFHSKKQTEEVKERKMVLRRKLHEILLTRFANCALYVVGSSMTGLGASSSDMDMCLMLTHWEIDQQREAIRILGQIRNLFRKYKFLTNVELIRAKVPILKFKDSVSGVEVDLNINNAIGIRNTQLLSSYARIDERLPPLIILAKLWARHHGINDAKNNSLSSYSIVLMVIHYLQFRCRPPVVPCLQILQRDKFHPNSDVRNLTPNEELPFFRSKNVKDLGDLFLGFLKYYSEEFDYNRVMSVRLGGLIPKTVAKSTLSPNNKIAHWNLLGIEEPFDLTNTARAVFREDVFNHVINVFTESWKRLMINPVLETLFC